MASSQLELTRQAFEQLELIDRAIVQEMFHKLDNPRDQVMTDHRIKNLIDMKKSKCLDTLLLVNDNDKLKRDEILILQGQKSIQANSTRKPDVWYNFYERLKEIKEYHKKFNPQQLPPLSAEALRQLAFQPPYKPPHFTGEEQEGKFIDLNKFFNQYVNFFYKVEKQNPTIDYIQYLQHFDELHEIPYAYKDKEYKDYKKYLDGLLAYLTEFFLKVQPLSDLQQIQKGIDEDFEKQWKEGTLKGWERRQEEVEEIKQNPLYCQACTKLFQNEHTFVHHLQGKKHKKMQKLLEKNQAQEQKTKENLEQQEEQMKQEGENKGEENKADEKNLFEMLEQLDVTYSRKKPLAKLEYHIMRMKELLSTAITETKNQISKKSTRTYEEMEAEAQNQHDVNEIQSDSEEEELNYNPKNLPLGWDGKPIPYWLYKLHGLGIEYKCEICGNYSYWGRRAFERHFQEWRHSYGMKCLKIPNTIHFKDITSIQDAIKLYDKIKVEQQLSQFNPEYEEEFEDNEGYLLNKKTYYDLKRQGML